MIGFKCRWPSNDPTRIPSNFDELRTWTLEQMPKYRSIHVRPAYTTTDGEMQCGETMSFLSLLSDVEKIL